MKRRLLIVAIIAVLLAIFLLTCDRCRSSKFIAPPVLQEVTVQEQPDTSTQNNSAHEAHAKVFTGKKRHSAVTIQQRSDPPTQLSPEVDMVQTPARDTSVTTPIKVSDSTQSPQIAASIPVAPHSLSQRIPDQIQVNTGISNEIWEGLSSSFSLPLGELMVMQTESEWRNLLTGFSVSATASIPLKGPSKSVLGIKSEGVRSGDLTLSMSIRYRPISYWFAGVTFYRYLNPDYKAHWSPEFSYTFGYNDWHPYTLSLLYSNYGGNRLSPDEKKGEVTTRFEEGSWSLGWKFIEPYYLQNLIVIFRDGKISHSINYNLTPHYLDLKSLEYRSWKQTLSLASNYTIYGNWYCGLTMFYYINPASRQPWNPDFTYGFGYFDWRPGKISVQYNNYSGNRFPWNIRSGGTGRFIDGAVSASCGWSF